MNQKNLVFHDEFVRINKSLEQQLEIRCMDLHSLNLALNNITDAKQVKVPSIYISYFLKKTSQEFYNEFVDHTKQNIELMLGRVNNYFTQNILYLAEEHLIEGLSFLTVIQSLSDPTLSAESFNEQLEKERRRRRMFGELEKEIKEKVRESGNNIVDLNSPCYSYLKNYVTLRNCLTHRGGKITKKESDLEIRLPYISQEQIDAAIKSESIKSINPQTALRKWNMGDTINLNLQEVEGIAYGLLKTSTEIMRHMYLAADKHVERITEGQ